VKTLLYPDKTAFLNGL